MNALTVIISFILTVPVVLIVVNIVRFTMTQFTDNLTIYYQSNVDLAFLTLSLLTIWTVIGIGLNKMGIGEKLSGGFR